MDDRRVLLDRSSRVDFRILNSDEYTQSRASNLSPVVIPQPTVIPSPTESMPRTMTFPPRPSFFCPAYLCPSAESIIITRIILSPLFASPSASQPHYPSAWPNLKFSQSGPGLSPSIREVDNITSSIRCRLVALTFRYLQRRHSLLLDDWGLKVKKSNSRPISP
jgi:hypothetical protein